MLPKTHGFPRISHASLIVYLVGKLSVPSITTSQSESKSNALFTSSLILCSTTSISGFNSRIRLAADSTFSEPTDAVEWITCLCRLVMSTLSSSIIPILPTPAAARYSKVGDPNPPAPTTITEDFFIFIWPSSPISGRIK